MILRAWRGIDAAALAGQQPATLGAVPMASDDLTLRVLIEIRDQISGVRDQVAETNKRLDGTNERLDRTNERLDQSVERLDRIEGRLDHHDKHLAAIGTEMVAVHAVLSDVVQVMKGRRKLESRVDRCEREIDELKRRLP
jgi:chromosome segregation ATPase